MKKAFGLALALVAVAGTLMLVGLFKDNGFEQAHPAPGKKSGGLHFVEAGTGPRTVIFLHGNPGTCLDFSDVQQQLPDVRTLAFDRPGYGWSVRAEPMMGPLAQAKALHAQVNALGIDKPVLAGFSYGGPVALAWALEFPEDVSGVVFLAAVGDPLEGHPMHGAQKLIPVPVLGALIAYGLAPLVGEGAVRSGYQQAFSPKPVQASVVDRGVLHFTRPSTVLASARDWKALETELPLLAARLRELKVPVEVLSAKDDQIVGDSHAKFLAAGIAGANLVEVDQAGHQLMSTHTSDVVAAVRRVLAR